MAITEERMTRLLAAAEDLERALKEACQMAKESAERARGTGMHEAELAQLALMSDPQLLLRSPISTLLAIEKEKEHWTSSRMRRNAKRRGPRRPMQGEGE